MSRRTALMVGGAGILAGGIIGSSATAGVFAANKAQDLILLKNGKILTMDANNSRATSILLRGNSILAVGGSEVDSLGESAGRVIDLQGRSVIPGINDTHFHFAQYAVTRPPLTVDLSSAKSIKDIQDKISEEVSKQSSQDSWIKAFGLHRANLSDSESQSFNKTDIDAVSKQHPVSIRENSSHSTTVNSIALQMAGITASSGPDVVLNVSGEPTGQLNGGAQNLIQNVQPPYTKEQQKKALSETFAKMHQLGITSYTEPVIGPAMGSGTGTGLDTLDVYLDLMRTGQLPMRVNVQMAPTPQTGGTSKQIDEFYSSWQKPQDLDPKFIRIESTKLFADSLGDPLVVAGDTPQLKEKELFAMFQNVHDRGLQIGYHVTGANDIGIVIRGIEAAMKNNPRPDPRHFLIHANSCTNEHLDSLEKLGIGVTMQPGLSAQTAETGPAGYITLPYRSALDKGVQIMTSSDAPVETPDWRKYVSLLMDRQTSSGQDIGKDQAISLEEALRTMTAKASWQSKSEGSRGTLAPGNSADICVFDKDINQVAAGDVESLNVAYTIFDGNIVYEK
ncbi:amidohydrolase family protein [Acaricomes phytoseiuli]|uniref:amidohydrolase n=1 Tax=Acaricomes phytoseiuli TaxID=291968 RepID=UPI00146143FA|nr:amidohydrolase family protein [Acaricomes phytoseiuli]MCW1248863.1 amidohydrolase family protein [Acaricomes phytoseiuli]